MSNKKADRLHVGQILECTIESIYPFGVFVQLNDGTPGFIRRRELSLVTDVDPRQALVDGRPLRRGRRLQAAVSYLPTIGKVELSIRATLRDPWLDLPDYPTNATVSATVHRLHPDGAQVEITPGVLGFIPLVELSPTCPAQPEEILWPGDHVKAVVTGVDRSARRLHLSIRRLSAQQAVVQSLMAQLSPPDTPTLAATSVILRPILLPAPVLVVEDHRELREPLVRWLRDQGCGARGVGTAEEALQLCAQTDFGLALVDLDLPNVDGLTFLRQLREFQPNMPAAVMSGPDMLAHHWATLRALDVLAAFDKPLDERAIREVLEQLSIGVCPELPAATNDEPLPTDLDPFPSETTDSRRVPLARIQSAIEQLIREVRADLVAVFHFDRTARTLGLLAQAGRGGLEATDLYRLLGSPVKDVIIDNRILWENSVASDDTRFRNLLDAVPFHSCVATPLEAGGTVSHALFVFGRDAYHFDTARLGTVLATGTLVRAALEAELFDERVRAETPFIISGNLASTLGHELFSTLSGLDLTIRNLLTELNRQTSRDESTNLETLRNGLNEASHMANQLQTTVREFQRLMRTGQEGLIDVNRVLRDACALVKPLAVRRHVRLAPEFCDDVLLVRGNEVRLLHVVLNLIHNAFQHISGPTGMVGEVRLASTWVMGEHDNRPIKIRLVDTGPGIHHEQWERIFDLGFTTREEGHGLGLYIARDAVEKMNGRISVEESYMGLGTTFLVELPAAE